MRPLPMSVRSDSCRAQRLTGGWASTKARCPDLPRRTRCAPDWTLRGVTELGCWTHGRAELRTLLRTGNRGTPRAIQEVPSVRRT
jgi:hypothetical protein